MTYPQIISTENPDVVDESFGDETVIVNLATGCYYSFATAPTQLWRSCIELSTIDEVLARHSDDADLALRTIAWLTAEGLLALSSPLDIAVGHVPVGIDKFDDIAELLKADPIHDVDYSGEGWPVVAPPSEA